MNADLDPHRWVAFGDVDDDTFLDALLADEHRVGRPDRVRHSWGLKHASVKFDHTLSSHRTPRSGSEPITWIAHQFTQRVIY